MASPLDNINSTQPPVAFFDHGGRQLAFGRPVQAHDTTTKQLPSPAGVLISPLPAAPTKREEIFVQACKEGDEAQVQHLLSAAPGLTAYKKYSGLVTSAVTRGQGGMVDLLLAFQKDNRDEYMLLLEAAALKATSLGKIDMVRALLKKGAPIEGRHTNLLHTAVMYSLCEIVEILLQAGADTEADQHRIWTESPLICAVTARDEGISMRLLLEFGADPNRRPANNTGPSPLEWACSHGNLCKVKILLEAGALIDREDHERDTPLAMAVANGHEEIVRHLLCKGADPNAACQPLQAPLYKALMAGRKELLEVLLAAGAAPDLRCDQEVSETPLMLAVQRGEPVLAELLVEHGADLHKTGPEGLSALEIAVRDGTKETVDMLREKAAQQAARPGAQPRPAQL